MARRKYESDRIQRAIPIVGGRQVADLSPLAKAEASKSEQISALVDTMKGFVAERFEVQAKESAAKIALENDPLKVLTETKDSLKIVDKLAFNNSLVDLQNNTIDTISTRVMQTKAESFKNNESADIFRGKINSIVAEEFNNIRNAGFDSPLFELNLQQKMQKSLDNEAQDYELSYLNLETKRASELQDNTFKKNVLLAIRSKDSTELNTFRKNNPEYDIGGDKFSFAERYIETERYDYLYTKTKDNLDKYNDTKVLSETLNDLYTVRDNENLRPMSVGAFEKLLDTIDILEDKKGVTNRNYDKRAGERKNANRDQINFEQQNVSSVEFIKHADAMDIAILNGQDKDSFIRKLLQDDPNNALYSEADIESYKKYWDQRSSHLREDRQGYVLAMSNEYKNILNADGSMDSADVQQRMRLSKQTGEFFTEEERNVVQSFLVNKNIDAQQKQEFLTNLTFSIPQNDLTPWLSTLVKNIDNDDKKLEMVKFGLNVMATKRTKITGIQSTIDLGAKVLADKDNLSDNQDIVIKRIKNQIDQQIAKLPKNFQRENFIFVQALKENTLNYVFSATDFGSSDPSVLVAETFDMFLGQDKNKTYGLLEINGNGVYVNYTDADINFTEDDYNNMINNFTEEDYLTYGYYVTPNGEVTKATELPYDFIEKSVGTGIRRRIELRKRYANSNNISDSFITRDDQYGDRFFMFVKDPIQRTALTGTNQSRFVIDYKAAREAYKKKITENRKRTRRSRRNQ